MLINFIMLDELEDVPKIFCVIMILVGMVLGMYGGVSLFGDDPNVWMFAVGMFLVIVFARILKKL
jgi:hypothetical protein